MQEVNVDEVDEPVWSSPKGRFAGAGKQRRPFDVEIARILP
jgi:hypothetical protein